MAFDIQIFQAFKTIKFPFKNTFSPQISICKNYRLLSVIICSTRTRRFSPLDSRKIQADEPLLAAEPRPVSFSLQQHPVTINFELCPLDRRHLSLWCNQCQNQWWAPTKVFASEEGLSCFHLLGSGCYI